MAVNISPSPTIPQGLLSFHLPHQSSSDDAGDTGRGEEVPTHSAPELTNKTLISMVELPKHFPAMVEV
jgi:hypothetical protein